MASKIKNLFNSKTKVIRTAPSLLNLSIMIANHGHFFQLNRQLTEGKTRSDHVINAIP